MKNFIERNKRKILFIIFYSGLFLLGLEIYNLIDSGLDQSKNTYIQISGLIAYSLLTIGCFLELYIFKKNK